MKTTAEGFEKTAEVSEKTAEVSEKTAKVSEKTAEGFEKTAEVSEKTAEVSEKTAKVSEKTAEGFEKTAEVFFATNRGWDGFCFSGECECEGEGRFGTASEGALHMMEKQEFFSRVDRYEKVVFFSHGFNNAFDSAVRNFAEYSKMLNLEHTAFVLLSWPSLGHLKFNHPISIFFRSDSPYIRDQENARDSGAFFGAIMSEMTRDKKKKQEVIAIAHSMGAQMMWSAFQEKKNKPKVDRIIFVAADLNFEFVEFEIQKHFGSGVIITHYFCPKDIALKFAELIGKKKCIGLGPISGIVNIEISKKIAKKNGGARHSYAMHELVIDSVSRQCLAKNGVPDLHNLVAQEIAANGWRLECAHFAHSSSDNSSSSSSEEEKQQA